MSDIFVPARPKSAGAQAADLPPRNDPIPQGPQKRKRHTRAEIAGDSGNLPEMTPPEFRRRGKQADPPAVAALKMCARTLRDLNDTDAKSVLALLRAVFE
jgi:hypothetical protein